VGAPPTIRLACSSWDQLEALLESDLRRGLFRLRLSRQPPVGADVRILLGLPSEETVTIDGRVQRHAPEHDDPQRGLGVEVLITRLPPEALLLIESSLRAARHTPPPVGLSHDDLFSDLAPIDEAPPLPTGISVLAAMPPEVVRANALVDGGHLDEAVELFDEVLRNRARDRDARAGKELVLGYRALAQNDRSAALRCFEKALQMIPANDRAARALDALRRSPGQSGTRILEVLLAKK
jgi:tetratricopeptide (TPR) repeat protein